jgi:hypothetical protein
MKWIICDIHGNFKTLIKLIEKIEEKDKSPEIIFTGDFIDRGPDSADVIEFVIDGIKNKGFQAVKGNHEQMLYEFLLSPFGGHYIEQGGQATIQSYKNKYKTNYMNKLKEDIDFIIELPYFIEFEDVDESGRNLVVSHAVCNDFHESFSNLYDSYAREICEDKTDKFENEFGVFARCDIFKLHESYTWNRELPKTPSNIFSISGHNITKYLVDKYGKENYQNEIIFNNDIGYACIDTGCFVDRNKKGFGGILTAMSFPDKKLIQINSVI